MTETRDTQFHFHQELEALEQTVLGVVDRAQDMIEMAVESLINDDRQLAEQVFSLRKESETTYFEVHQEWTRLMARFQPLGSDLRRMAVLLQLNITFERMGAQCGNIARTTLECEGLPRVERTCDQIREMGDLAQPMIRTAVEAYLRRDLDEARLLPAMDEPIDRLNAGMYKEIVAVRENPELLEFATKCLMVSRALERIGDQAVDFAEQTAYLVTGERVAFEENQAKAPDDGSD